MTEKITQLLHKEGCSCVIAHGTEIRTFHQRGVADLYNLLRHDAPFLEGAVIADKVVGKAAAALMVLGHIHRLHADVISEPALALLQEAGIETEADQTVHHIENRAKNGWCPLETASYPLSTAEEVLLAIEEFLSKR